MKNILGYSLAALTLLATAPAFAAHWFETDGFKKNHGEWSGKFSTAHKALTDTRAAHKGAQDAVKAAGKDKGKRADAAKAAQGPQKAVWEAELAWLKLHQEWRAYELPKAEKSWDDRVAKIKDAQANWKGAKELKDARVALWTAEISWIDANRLWKKSENGHQQKHWADRIEKINAAIAKIASK